MENNQNSSQIKHSVLEKLARRAIEELNSQGFMSPGHNGPYYDQETPLRNTAHWLITFSKLYQITDDLRYYTAVKQCADYLSLPKHRPGKTTFYMRDKKGKDKCNGLIGQAWVIEALAEAYLITGEQKYVQIAREVFLVHPFDPEFGLWESVEITGSDHQIDVTFNHQLWFAAVGGILGKLIEDELILTRIRVFFECITENCRIHENGLIKHLLPSGRWVTSTMELSRISFRKILSWTLNTIRKTLGFLGFTRKSGQLDLAPKENGYHQFNLYAFALLKNAGQGQEFFNSDYFLKILIYCFSQEIRDSWRDPNHNTEPSYSDRAPSLTVNRYGFAYNAPGFEMPFIYYSFKEELSLSHKEIMEQTIEDQMKYTFDPTEFQFSKNTDDPKTLTARIYEYMRAAKQAGGHEK